MTIQDLRKDNRCEVETKRSSHSCAAVSDSPERDGLIEREDKWESQGKGTKCPGVWLFGKKKAS